MSGTYDDLIALADLDTELVTLERSRGVLAARVALAQLADRFAEIERARQLLEPEAAPLRAALASLEEDVGRLSQRKSQIEARLASATGAGRDLEAMHAEARHLGELMSELEDQELDLMERLEPLELRLEALRTEVAPLLAERDELQVALEGEESALEASLAERRGVRASLTAKMESSLLSRYEKIAAHEHGTGAARLEHGTCGGCHLALPAAELDRLRHLPVEELSTCEQCQRILVRPDQLSG